MADKDPQEALNAFLKAAQEQPPIIGERWPTYYWGRKWDAPVTDDAILMDEALVDGLLPHPCDLCREAMTKEDNILLTPGMSTHLECNIRSALGDVQHLEGRCICSRPGDPIVHEDEKDQTYRESAKAAVQWLIDNKRGRFHD